MALRFIAGAPGKTAPDVGHILIEEHSMTDSASLPPLIPRDVLFGNPSKEGPQISPDGTKMAYLAPVDGVLNVWAGPIDGDAYQPVTEDRDRGVRNYFWTYDSKRILYLQDVGGDEDWRLFSTDLASRSTDALTPFEKVQVRIIAYDKQHPTEMIIGMNKDDERLHDAYRLDLETGELRQVAKNPGNVVGWVADAQLHVRAAQAATADAGFELLVRDSDDDDWRALLKWSSDESLNSGPLEFTQDGSAIYLTDARDANAGRLVKLDIASGGLEVIAGDSEYDVGSAMIHPDTRDVQMVSFVRARREWLVLDDSIREDVDAVAAVNSGDFGIYDRTNADDIWLVGFMQDVGPVAYHAFDRKTKQSRLLFHNRPELLNAVLAEMRPVSFQSRDGLTIHGYLTLPVASPDTAKGSLVLNVHGGPWHRDVWGYNPEAQWFANRGYACLQVNFRGSTGYGKKFLNAGDREWGRAMHNDLVDAVEWTVREGVADADKLAIYGGSYGGYAALAGATFTPDLFCCAVDIVGPSNLLTFIESIPPYWSAFLETMHKRVGNPDTDEELLRERSPLFSVDNIKIPMLIAQGANDPRVKQAESEHIVAAMEAKGIDYEYMLFEDEGHGFAKPENRLKFYGVAESFLAKHLGGRVEERLQIAD
jgi:dipeptidyl aminopeptidase/acylaminoacyl peptidase